MNPINIGTNSQEPWVGEDRPVFVIAEIGKNFIQSEDERSVDEYLRNAIALAQAAKDAGAHAVKYQTHTVEDEQANVEVVSPHFKGSDRYRWVKRNEDVTPMDGFWKPLKEACDKIGIPFFSTPMSRASAQKLDALNVPFWKVGSGDILDFVMLDYLRRSGKPIIVSTGMSTLEEIDLAVNFLKEKTDQIVILHCVSRYPCPPEDLHLETISFLCERYGLPTGFSDHSIGTESAIAAAALGARVIEKHFSFDRTLWGSDHKVSLVPEELRTLVQGVQRVREDETYREEVLESDLVKCGMGAKQKTLQEDEAVFRPLFRKTLCAADDLPAGTVLQAEHLYAMRPQAYLNGLPSERYPDVLGKTVKQALQKFSPISNESIGSAL